MHPSFPLTLARESVATLATMRAALVFGILLVQACSSPFSDQIPATSSPSKTASSASPVSISAPVAGATSDNGLGAACVVVTVEKCSLGQRVTITTTVNGSQVTTDYVGFDLPLGTAVFATTDGLLDKADDGGPFVGFIGVIRAPCGGWTLRGALDFGDLLSKQVRTGDLVGHVRDGVRPMLGFNLLVTATRRTISGPIVDEQQLRMRFPSAYQKPALTIDAGTQQPIVFISNSSAPPDAATC